MMGERKGCSVAVLQGRVWSTVDGDGTAAAVPTRSPLTQNMMETAEVTGQQTAAWVPGDGRERLLELLPPLLQHHLMTLPAHWLKEERHGYIFLNHPILTSELAVWPKLNQQIC